MSWNNCQYPECEAWAYRPDADYCESHRRSISKEAETSRKQSEKREQLLKKAKDKSQKPRQKISKNPADWSNTFLCSDGVRVTQVNINQMYSGHRNQMYSGHRNQMYSGHRKRRKTICEGCGSAKAVCNAHIIAKARCKQIGKTELIWDSKNMFDSCYMCNQAIENPKGKAWKRLKNIDKCLAFIKIHDPELYTKFELSAINQENEKI